VLSAGYEALEASDADEAIRILESRDDIDLVFTDVQMPGTMDGIKLSHHIKDRWPPVKLIVASGASILEESSLPMGSRFFSKPYDDLKITEAMARLLSSELPSALIT
jgi:CheY-like chemotaxis protein